MTFKCRVGWHNLRANTRKGEDRCVDCGRTWKLWTVPMWAGWLLILALLAAFTWLLYLIPKVI